MKGGGGLHVLRLTGPFGSDHRCVMEKPLCHGGRDLRTWPPSVFALGPSILKSVGTGEGLSWWSLSQQPRRCSFTPRHADMLRGAIDKQTRKEGKSFISDEEVQIISRAH